MKPFLATLFFILCFGTLLVGCSDPEPTSVVKDADPQAIADYERMIEEDSKRDLSVDE